MIVVMMAALTLVQTATTKPTGASILFTSPHPLAVRTRELIADGRYAEADRLLEAEAANADNDLARLITEAREIIRRLRRDYDLDLAGLLSRLEKSIPDVTAEDLERWRKAEQVQYRVIDDQVCYFRREPSNIFRFCDEAKRRRDEHASLDQPTPQTKPTPQQRLHEHLAAVIDAAENQGETMVTPVRHRLRYQLTVLPDRPGARIGSVVRCWLPFPQEYRQQRNVKLIRTFPPEHVIAPNATDGRILGGAPQRTVYLERRIEDPARPVVFTEEFEYVSFAYYPKLDDQRARPLPPDYHGGYLDERPPHIRFTPELIDTVQEVVGSEANPLARGRKIFHFVDAGIRYCAEEEYSTIPGFSAKALRSRRGDCGIQAMLFITMCRGAGIPARWQSGWQTRPGAWNMHDWAEFYVEPWGWLPADVSLGRQESDEPRIREFYFGHQDSYRLIGNLDYASALHPPKQSLRSEPADFQRGEIEIDGRNLYFDDWEWDVSFDLKPMLQGAGNRNQDPTNRDRHGADQTSIEK